MAALQKLQTDEEQVLAANREFYTALNSLNASTMKQLWLQEDWVMCLHPGWELLVGWEEVGASWDEIFRSTEQMMVSVTRAMVHVTGDMAWISCLENVTTASKTEVSSVLVEATNIYQRHQGRWLMVHHHTTPLIQEQPPETFTPLQ